MKKLFLSTCAALVLLFIVDSANAQVTPTKRDTTKRDTVPQPQTLPVDTNRTDPNDLPMKPDTMPIPTVPPQVPPTTPPPIPPPEPTRPNSPNDPVPNQPNDPVPETPPVPEIPTPPSPPTPPVPGA